MHCCGPILQREKLRHGRPVQLWQGAHSDLISSLVGWRLPRAGGWVPGRGGLDSGSGVGASPPTPLGFGLPGTGSMQCGGGPQKIAVLCALGAAREACSQLPPLRQDQAQARTARLEGGGRWASGPRCGVKLQGSACILFQLNNQIFLSISCTIFETYVKLFI